MSTTTTEGQPVASSPAPVAPVVGIADPAPLGLAAFAMTTLLLSLANTQTWPAGALSAIALALAYGGSVQLLAGMWEFKRGNTFGATAFSSYGAFWISFWYLETHTKVLPADAAVVVGTFLMGWTIFTAYMFVATLRLNLALVVVFGLLTLTFVALTIGNFQTSANWIKLGGWLGVATAAAAWYTSFAIVLESTFKRVVLPLVPFA